MLRLYVVELDAEVQSSRRFRDANTAGSGKGCLYVGSTAHDVEHRYAQHKAGVHATRGGVTKLGTRLRHDLMPSVSYATRPEAEAAEARLADSLRKEGYLVWSR